MSMVLSMVFLMRVMACFMMACVCSCMMSFAVAGSRVHTAHQPCTAQETQCSPTEQHIYYARGCRREAVVEPEKLREALFAG